MSQPSPDPAVDAPLPVALVTGGTRGIGRAIVDVLASTHHVLVGGRDASAVRAIVAEFPSASPFIADLGDEEGTRVAASSVDRLDVLVHCAGIMPPADAPVREAWRRVLEVNLVGVVHLTELLLPALRASSGLLIFVNSGSGLRAMGDTSGYSASKFALTSFADGLRESERGRVRVSSLHPGRVDTDMQRDLQARAGKSYRSADHLTRASVAAVVRAIVDAPPEAVLESVSIRPAGAPPV
jgi:NAD(P)-dependent dehydrogenase (short-subunit alcohol dehydrogenase family)